MDINKWTLSLEKSLEKEFRKRFFDNSILPFRIAFLSLIGLYAIFGILDNVIYPEIQPGFYVIRYFIVVPFLFSVFILSFTKLFRHFWQYLLMMAYIVAGGGIISMLILLPQTNHYYSGMVLVFFAGYVFIKLRFIYATIAGWTLLALFNLGFYLFTDYNLKIIITQNFFYISANLIAMFAAYYIELFSKRDFLAQIELIHKKEEIEKINQDLEHLIEDRTLALQMSQEQYMLAVKGSNDGIWDWNILQNQYYLSPKAKQNLGYEDKDLRNEMATFEKLLHPDDKRQVMQNLEDYLNGKKLRYSQEFRLLHKDGKYRWILSRGEALRDENGVPYRMAGSHTDITQRKIILDILQKRSEVLYRINQYTISLNAAPYEEMFAILREKFSDIFNLKHVVLFDYHSWKNELSLNLNAEQVDKSITEKIELSDFFKNMVINISDIDYQKLSQELVIVNHSLPYTIAKNAPISLKNFCHNNDFDWFMQIALVYEKELIGMIFTVGKKHEPIPENDEICNFASVTASSIATKKAEKKVKVSEKHHRTLVENANEGIIVTIGENIVFSNPKIIEITGYPKDYLHEEHMFHLIFPEDRELAEKEYLALWNNEKNTQHFQIRIVAKSGELKWLDLSGVKIEWEGYPAIMTFVSDITEAKIANDQIKRSLREKEILIKEIHHRVKNNLQIVNSLINLQLRNVSDATARELLNYTRNRVKAISIVHEKVYQSERLDEINARDYISSLMRNLHSVVEQKNVTIETVVKVDDVILPLDSAVPCALIINELVTNAYKYAFVNANHGKLELTFSKKDDNYYLSVWDDGIGFDESFDIHSSDSFGMTIITSQVGQLKGNYSISNKNGAFFEITFPYKPKREYL